MTEGMDGSTRITWLADGLEAIDVYARWRTRRELDEFAQAVADVALINRSVADLRRGLRDRLGGGYDIVEDTRTGSRRIVVSMHPPPGNPNPDV